MTRIGTFVQQQAILAQYQNTNARLNQDQSEIATGKVAQHYKDLAPQAGALLSAQRLDTRTAEYQQNNKQLATTLSIQDTSLNQVATSTQNLRQSILDADSLDSGGTLMQQVQGAFAQVLSVLNTQVNGAYIFGGTRTDQPPVTAQTLGDLQAVPSVTQVFKNNDQPINVEIATGESIKTNFLATDVGQSVMDSLKQIADYNAGPNGPFGATLTDAQKTFLAGQAQNLQTITQNLNQIVGQNGQLQNQVDDANTRHEATSTTVKGFISDITDADVAKAVSNLNQDQVTLQASARLIADLQTNSLLNYLPTS
jgi:flagellar hook-associated protein 3 FlgL